MKYAGHLLFPHIIHKEVEMKEIREHISDRVDSSSGLAESNYCVDANLKCLNVGSTECGLLFGGTYLSSPLSHSRTSGTS